MTEERKQNFPKRHVPSPINKVIVVASIIIFLFLLFLYCLICLTQKCPKELNESGSWTCFWPLTKDCPEVLTLCRDLNNFTCNYLGDEPEYHVHMFVWFSLCGNIFDDVTELQMWEHDRYLHFADDQLRDCTPVPRDVGLYKCHHRSSSQIEGIFKGQDPEIYFKVRINCSTEDNPDCEYFFSTLPAGELIPKKDPNDCYHKPYLVENFYQTFQDVWFFDLNVGSPDFREVDQKDNWFVWKCYVELDFSPFFNDSCDLQNYRNQYTPINFSKVLHTESTRLSLMIIIFILFQRITFFDL